jgi:alpha,alpha-trehalase
MSLSYLSEPVKNKIHDTWNILLRTAKDIPNMHDSKLPADDGKVWLYYAENHGETRQRIEAELGVTIGNDWREKITLESIPEDFLENPSSLQNIWPHGLLYLPYPYLVPGGRFNEMYGWDSHFGILGCVDETPELARQMVDNHIYAIRHYGVIPNANRTYYLTRSQPPLLSLAVTAILNHAHRYGWQQFDPTGIYQNRDHWLTTVYNALVSHHEYWNSGERLAGNTGLSRYTDSGDWPAPEVVHGEPGHYDTARNYFNDLAAQEYIPPHEKRLLRFFRDEVTGELTSFFYQADRAMRATGFDPTGRFGHGGITAMMHAVVCLNASLCRMEKDLAAYAHVLDKPEEKREWLEKAQTRRQAMDLYMWDEILGQYCDYDFETGERNSYLFASGFWPLWLNVLEMENPADREKAERIIRRHLEGLETPHGLLTSDMETGCQWDKPYQWPPLMLSAVEAMERFGYLDDALRVAENYLNCLNTIFAETGALYEKSNALTGTPDVNVTQGYNINVTEWGTFLWTAAVAKLLEQAMFRMQAQRNIPHKLYFLGGAKVA